jgi:hypothetical protein
MPFYVFTIGSGLLVLGFTFGVIYATSGLTEIKSPEARGKYLWVGITSVVAGLLVALWSLMSMAGNEKIAMITAGANIGALGISTLIRWRINPKNKKAVWYSAWGIIIVGFLLLVAYEVVHILMP